MPLTPEERKRFITPENTSFLKGLLFAHEKESDIPEFAYLLVDSLKENPPIVTPDDIEWADRIYREFLKRQEVDCKKRYEQLAHEQELGKNLL